MVKQMSWQGLFWGALCAASLVSGRVALAQDDGYAHHPMPVEPQYAKAEWYDKVKKQVTPPPQAGDARQRADEDELYRYQKERSEAECARAKTEVMVGLVNFYGKPYGNLEAKSVQVLTPFFARLRNDADFFIQKLKVDLPRPRPFLYLRGLTPCVAKEQTGAYPSGHATLSRLYALVLADIYPAKRESFLARAKVIGDDRVLAGMHHRSDVTAGGELADVLYKEFQKNEAFKKDFAAARALVL